MKDKLAISLLSILPKKTLSRCVGKFAESKFSANFISFYAKYFNIDIEQAEKPISEYHSIKEFFIRKLKSGLRPIADDPAVTSPVDGKISAFGKIKDGMLIQAKGVNYTVENLLGRHENSHLFYGGTFITIYLSPRDYHRIHAPLSGKISAYSYIPGTLFPVNALGVRAVKGLFAKNERLISYLDSTAGKIAVVKVGATIVGSVKVSYDETIGTNVKNGKITHKKTAGEYLLAKGDEIGYFAFGSTVILLFEPGKIKLRDDLCEGMTVRMGEKIGETVQ